MLFVTGLCLFPVERGVLAADLPIYADALSAGWADWSWNTTVSMTNTSPVHDGSHSLSVRFDAGWAGLYLHAAPGISLATYEKIRFWIFSGVSGNQKLRLVANSDVSVPVATQANTWTEIEIPFTDLGSPATLEDLYWQDTTGSSQPVFYLDDITLVELTGPPRPPVAGPALTIDSSAARHPISEGIYGMSYADEQLAAELRLPVRRWGGNSTSRYNWQNDTTNTGSDWYFENIAQENRNIAALPDGSAADRFVEQDRRTGTRTLLTMPLIGWTAKRRVENHPYDCGFKVSSYGAQQSVDPWDTDCGNGRDLTGVSLVGNNPADTSTVITPAFLTVWIKHLAGKYGTASNGGVAYYNLDNEPMLWNSTHRDVHPDPVTYDEIRDRTWEYAAAIKAADPAAKTLGPVLWGWCAYFYSAADGCGNGADYQAHGNTPFTPWYLRQMKSYGEQHGVRILDYLDLHNYPQANGVALSAAGNAATQALRLRSTRSLWDTTYVDESWIPDTVRLIPRMKEWVNAEYPGTKLAITEYNWGALDHINGALAQADVLGIFGREGLDLAALWGPPTSSQPGAYAFRIYRNYDGTGSGYGDMSVQATSADQGTLSVYAAQRSADNALTVVVINKTTTAMTSSIALSGFKPAAAAQVYRYSATLPDAIEHPADQAVTPTGFAATFPADSITLFVFAPRDGSNDTTKADFTAAPTSGAAPLIVTFTDTSVNSPTSWLWDFGDGIGSNLQTPTHVYQNAGSYTVALTATGTDGASTRTKSSYIAVATCANLPVRVKETGAFYPTIQDAVALGADTTVQIRGLEFAENVVLTKGVRVMLQGGYDCDYAAHPLFSTMHGSLTVGTGTVVIANIVIK
jgi:hypothetical protein